MLSWEVEECQHRLFVLCQAGNTFWVFDAILFFESTAKANIAASARVSGVLNVVQIRLHRRVPFAWENSSAHSFTLCTQHRLVFCAWKRLIQRIPEAHGPVAYRDLGRDGQSATS